MPFRQALRELGYIEGQNIALPLWRGAPDRLATVAAELVRHPVDLIARYGTPATYAGLSPDLGPKRLQIGVRGVAISIS
jgi:hypothetical protein